MRLKNGSFLLRIVCGHEHILVPDTATLDLPGMISGNGIIGLGTGAELALGGTVGSGQTIAGYDDFMVATERGTEADPVIENLRVA